MGRQELPPHAYATSAAAFNGIQEGGPNQSVLVSGESGAGKTETTKHALTYLSEVAGGTSGVEQKVGKFSALPMRSTMHLIH